MRINEATLAELEKIELIYSEAREFMKANGNGEQWGNGYPSRDIILRDIERGELYTVCESDEILAVFFAAMCDEPTYRKLYGGEWKTTSPCGVIHRVAVSGKARGKGVSAFIFSEMTARFGSLRIDTHKNNIPMQRALLKNGFRQCGIIYIGETEGLTERETAVLERIAYERVG